MVSRIQPKTLSGSKALVLAIASLGLLGCPPPKAAPPGPIPDTPVKKGGDPEKPPPEKKPDQFEAVGEDTSPVSTDTFNESVARIQSDAKVGILSVYPHMRVFVKEKRIEIDGVTSLKVGPQLELLACGPNGKAYESLLLWNVNAKHVQFGLLAIGMTPTPQVKRFGQRKSLRKGERVVIEVEWKEPDGKTVRRRVEDLLYDVSRDGCMKHAGWVFTGSGFLDVPAPDGSTRTIFMAQETGTIAVTYHDPDAILDTPLREGGDNTLFVAWAQRLPERGTPIVAHIRPWRAGDDAEPPDAKRRPDEERPPGGGAPGGGMGAAPRAHDEEPEEPDDDTAPGPKLKDPPKPDDPKDGEPR